MSNTTAGKISEITGIPLAKIIVDLELERGSNDELWKRIARKVAAVLVAIGAGVAAAPAPAPAATLHNPQQQSVSERAGIHIVRQRRRRRGWLWLALGLELLLAAAAPAAIAAPERYRLEADQVVTVPGDFATMQAAWDRIQAGVDLACHKVQVQVADGSYPEVVLRGALTGACSDDAVTFTGNVEHPDRVIVSGVNANAITVLAGAWVKLEGFLIVAVEAKSFMSGGHGLQVYQRSRVELGTMAWYNCDYSHIDLAEDAHLHAEASSQYLLGASPIFLLAEAGARAWMNGALITTLAPMNFGDAFVHTSQLAMVDLSGTILNNIYPLAGRRYFAQSGSLIVWLGMNPRGLSGGTVERGATVIP